MKLGLVATVGTVVVLSWASGSSAGAVSTESAQPAIITTTTTVAPVKTQQFLRIPAGFAFHDETRGLKPEVRYRTELLLADPDNKGQVKLNSGYRTPEQQQRQIDCHARGEAGCMPADPIEKSMHVKGEAIDLGGPAGLRKMLAERYGFYNPYKTADEAHHFELDPNRQPTQVG